MAIAESCTGPECGRRRSRADLDHRQSRECGGQYRAADDQHHGGPRCQFGRRDRPGSNHRLRGGRRTGQHHRLLPCHRQRDHSGASRRRRRRGSGRGVLFRYAGLSARARPRSSSSPRKAARRFSSTPRALAWPRRSCGRSRISSVPTASTIRSWDSRSPRIARRIQRPGSCLPRTLNAKTTPSYPNFFGTSAATPHAAGIAALALQASPTATPAQIYGSLRSSALPMSSTTPNFNSGYGFIQADAALRCADAHARRRLHPARQLDHARLVDARCDSTRVRPRQPRRRPPGPARRRRAAAAYP